MQILHFFLGEEDECCSTCMLSITICQIWHRGYKSPLWGKWRPLCNRAIMVPRGWELIFHRLLLFLLSWFFGSNIDRIISKSLGEKNNGFPLSSSCFRSFCTRETFSREDAWSCCLAIKTFEIFFWTSIF